MKRLDPLVWCAIAVGGALGVLALIPTQTWAELFAHPARVQRLHGQIPEATWIGARTFRVALALSAITLPALVAWMAHRRRCERAQSPTPYAIEALGQARTSVLILCASIAIGTLLRVLLAQESLWYDEISAFLSFALEGPGVAFGSYAVPTNHVPMTIAVWASTSLTGSMSELAMRAPALVAGVGSIPAAWMLMREVAPSEIRDRAAAFAAGLVAMSPIFLVESAEARGYAFVMCSTLVATWAWARAQRTRLVAYDVVFACAAAFAAWSHPVALLFPVAACCIGLWKNRTGAIAAVLSCTIAALLLSPLVGDVLSTRDDYVRSQVGQPSVWSREGFEGLSGLALSWGLPLGSLPWIRSTSWSAWLVVPPIVLIGVLLVGMRRVFSSPTLARARDACMPSLFAFVLAYVAALVLGTWIYARFLVFAVPLSVILITLGWALLRTLSMRLVVFVLVVLQCAITLPFFWTKQPIRNAVDVVALRRNPTDSVLTIGLPDNAVGFYALSHGFEAEDTGFLGADLDRAPRGARFVIVLYPERITAETLATLDRGFDRTHRFEGWADWGHGAVEVWERRAAPR